MNHSRGYTLIELIVAVGLFALVMTMVAGVYIIMINLTLQSQSAATGINNLSFALETMTRSIRTGTHYTSDGSTFSFINVDGHSVYFNRSSSSRECGNTNGCITRKVGSGAAISITDPSVDISSLNFAVYGGAPWPDKQQPYVTISVSGTVSQGAGKPPQSFTIQTGAAQRVLDL